jgi:hypothetical protein
MIHRKKEGRTKGASLQEITAKHHDTSKAQLTNHEKRFIQLGWLTVQENSVLTNKSWDMQDN